MPDRGGPSETARRVAAYRLGFERLAANGGDPGDDDRLAADVAADVIVDRSSPMDRYLRARTRFFDRVVVNALDRHVAQIVVIGAGYDGRALRYRSPGVRWWEVDRHRTQRDKRTRMERLGISTDGVTFVALDLSDGGVAAALVEAGFEPDAPALFVLEGVAPYLDAETLREVLGDLRSLATPGTRLAISLGRPGADPAARLRFEASVEAMGEPAVESMSAEAAPSFLAGCRWRPIELSERAAAAGFAMAAPVFAPAWPGAPDAPRTNEARVATPPSPAMSVAGEFVTELFDYDGGRQVTVYVPPAPPEAIVFAGDGELTSQWGATLETADVPSTMIVGVHGLVDETLRLHEYSPVFEPARFSAHEAFFVEEVRRWVRSNFEVALPAERTAVCGVSAGGELALALGLRHPDVYGAIFCTSPGAGYKPPAEMPTSLPRTYLVAGTREPFFRENATRWAAALRDAGGDVVMVERVGSHGGAFWREEFPLMVKWAFLPMKHRGPDGSTSAMTGGAPTE